MPTSRGGLLRAAPAKASPPPASQETHHGFGHDLVGQDWTLGLSAATGDAAA
ncbi:hypothetical protein ACF064_21595 [Streptomyces sp. NPDC015492]|uniref:hypothetical protein n=1 Tax=Streptomyces sp. NPDC015492 TaxID=3364958 RepID=UPI0036F995DF